MGGSKVGAEGQLPSPCTSPAPCHQLNNIFNYVVESINVLCQQLLCCQGSLAQCRPKYGINQFLMD